MSKGSKSAIKKSQRNSPIKKGIRVRKAKAAAISEKEQRHDDRG